MADIGMKINKRKGGSSKKNINEGEESIIVDVKALATAFRAVGAGDAGKKKGRRGRTGRK